MDQEVLVESKIEETIELVRRLDASGLEPKFAAWYLYDDVNEWRFLLSSPALDPLLPKNGALAYRKVVEVMAQFPHNALAVSDLKLIPTGDKLPSSLHRFFGNVGTGPDSVKRADCSDNMLNGIFIKHIVILRSA